MVTEGILKRKVEHVILLYIGAGLRSRTIGKAQLIATAPKDVNLDIISQLIDIPLSVRVGIAIWNNPSNTFGAMSQCSKLCWFQM